jgi:hypothetical protein
VDGVAETIGLFRAVSAAELRDILEYGGFRGHPDGVSLEAKLFATSAHDAADFGRALYRLDGQPFTIVEAHIPGTLAAQLERIQLDWWPAVVVSAQQLAALNAAAKVEVLPTVPLGGA